MHMERGGTQGEAGRNLGGLVRLGCDGTQCHASAKLKRQVSGRSEMAAHCTVPSLTFWNRHRGDGNRWEVPGRWVWGCGRHGTVSSAANLPDPAAVDTDSTYMCPEVSVQHAPHTADKPTLPREKEEPRHRRTSDTTRDRAALRVPSNSGQGGWKWWKRHERWLGRPLVQHSLHFSVWQAARKAHGAGHQGPASSPTGSSGFS